MKRKIFLPLAILIFAMTLTACGEVPASSEPVKNNSTNVAEENISMTKLKITVGDKIFHAVLENNATAKDFMSKLPTTLKMENLYGREMCYNYGAGGLTADKTRNDGYKVGDIIYWKPFGSFVILYKQNGEEYERVHLGHITDGDLNIFEGGGDMEIKFEIAE